MGLLSDDKSATTIAEEKLELIYDLEDAGKIDAVSNVESAAVRIVTSASDTFHLDKN